MSDYQDGETASRGDYDDNGKTVTTTAMGTWKQWRDDNDEDVTWLWQWQDSDDDETTMMTRL